MAIKDYIDKETRNLLLVLLGLGIFMLVIFPRIESQLFSFGSGLNIDSGLLFNTTTTPTKTNTLDLDLDKSKDYKLSVNTNLGTFVIDLDEDIAPKNIANIVNIVSSYDNSKIEIDRDYLFKIDSQANPDYIVKDEINADYLLLDRTKVRDAKFLSDFYDSNNSSTDNFSPDSLRRYADFTLKEFYSEVLGYEFSNTISTPKATKYMVYMASTGPNNNKNDFFVVMTNNPQGIDGRYTPIGRVTEGFNVLDNINIASKDSVSVKSINLIQK